MEPGGGVKDCTSPQMRINVKGKIIIKYKKGPFNNHSYEGGEYILLLLDILNILVRGPNYRYS